MHATMVVANDRIQLAEMGFMAEVVVLPERGAGGPGTRAPAGASPSDSLPMGNWISRGGIYCSAALRRPAIALGFLGLGAVLCGFTVGAAAYLWALLLLLLLAIGFAWPWVSIRAIDASLVIPTRRVHEGEPIVVQLALRNRLPIPHWGLTLLLPGLRRTEQATLRAVGPWERVEGPWNLGPLPRGIYPVESPRLACGFPFGVWRAAKPLQAQGRLVVWPAIAAPRVGRLPELEVAQEGLDPRGNRAGGSGDLLGVRPFRQGDRLRHIHWSATARSESLIVCERQRDTLGMIGLLIHPHRGAMHRGDENEQLLRVGGGIAQWLSREGLNVQAFFDGQTFSIAAGGAGIRALLDAMAAFDSWHTVAAIHRDPFPQGLPVIALVTASELAAGPLENHQANPSFRWLRSAARCTQVVIRGRSDREAIETDGNDQGFGTDRIARGQRDATDLSDRGSSERFARPSSRQPWIVDADQPIAMVMPRLLPAIASALRQGRG
jgi:uncharacterized protein (DUF58 family)